MNPPSRGGNSNLYRTLAAAVILAIFALTPALSVAQDDAAEIVPQEKPKPKKHDGGPRALALLEIASSGRGTVVPIAILVDGKFYDASIYKATPVPLSLEAGTIYEGQRAGNSLGLFTISTALHSDDINAAHRWLGRGAWLARDATVLTTTHKAETAPVGINNNDGPPRLSKSAPNSGSSSPPPAEKTPSVATEDKTAAKNSEAKPAQEPAPSSPPPSGQAQSRSADDSPVRLRRGKPTQPVPDDKEAPKGILQTMLAISDEGGPEASSFQYAWDKTEQAMRQTQITTLAEEALRAYLAQPAVQASAAAKPTTGAASKPLHPGPGRPSRGRASKIALPVFQNVKLASYDVWRGNQPVLIFSAEAEPAPAKSDNQHPDAVAPTHYFVTIVARSDIYGTLKKLYASVTDRQHLDVTPHLELLDAVDADGDGRGELVFREITDAASGYVIYRPTADTLYGMYDSLHPQ